MEEMDQLINAYFALIQHSVVAPQRCRSSTRTRFHDFPPEFSNLPEFSKLMVPTQGNLEVTVRGFEAKGFRLVGGVNAPKVVTCLGSDGRFYLQLVKGNDDLRQDAVMQQIFGLVDTLLRGESFSSQRRQLGIRTYRVIPLSPAAGILEWVQQTTPMAHYLLGEEQDSPKSAHLRYRPQDLTSRKCAEMLKSASDAGKRAMFDSITERFRPVFHHFFLENFADPSDWYQKRVSYTRSVAASSIVGYIVGLGDRHLHNILVDLTSAEVIHIDLGVAFEQGKLLAIPETIPFRLTPDVVDGMGSTGIEGIFRRCCEITMQVLRQNRDAVLTVLQVFLHDPLFVWQLSMEKLNNLQRNPLQSANPSFSIPKSETQRILMRAKAKLQGLEYGEPLSIQGQVNQLINEAKDPERLAFLYPGWAPFL